MEVIIGLTPGIHPGTRPLPKTPSSCNNGPAALPGEDPGEVALTGDRPQEFREILKSWLP